MTLGPIQGKSESIFTIIQIFVTVHLIFILKNFFFVSCANIFVDATYIFWMLLSFSVFLFMEQR